MGWGQSNEAQEVIRIWQTRDRAIELRTRLSNDYHDTVAVEELARLYYYDFLDQNGGVRFADADRWEPDDHGRYDFPHLEPAFANCADSALWYLLHLWSRNPEVYDYLYYPIVQLENYLNLDHTAYILPPEAYSPGRYFPDNYFTVFNLDDWQHNYTVDLLEGMKQARDFAHMAALRLADMDERDFHGTMQEGVSTHFRLLESRLGVCRLYRIDLNGGLPTLYYKEAGMNPKPSLDSRYHYSVLKEAKRQISREQWQEFQRLLDSIDFDLPLPYSPCGIGTDGPTFLLEQISADGYMARSTACPDVLEQRLVDLLKKYVGRIR